MDKEKQIIEILKDIQDQINQCLEQCYKFSGCMHDRDSYERNAYAFVVGYTKGAIQRAFTVIKNDTRRQ